MLMIGPAQSAFCRVKIEFVQRRSYNPVVCICYLLCICAVVQLNSSWWSNSLHTSWAGQKLACAARASSVVQEKRHISSPVAADAVYALSALRASLTELLACVDLYARLLDRNKTRQKKKVKKVSAAEL